jgi:DNA-binding LacI/PurR family transcriptional regulator
MLRTVKDPPTAIFAASDALAFGVINAVQDLGYSVPEDISVAGFDDEEMSRHLSVPLTTVRVHKQEMGIEAGKRLIEIIEGEVTKPIKIVLSTETVIRKSTAEPPKVRGEGQTR